MGWTTKNRLIAGLGAAIAISVLFAFSGNSGAEVVVTEAVPFCTTTGRTGEQQILLLDIARPKAQEKTLPGITVLVHGGGWSAGSRKDYRFMLEALAGQGLVAVSVDYGLAPHSTFPGPLADVKCAVRWVRENAALYRFDTSRVVVMGGSAGATLAALVGTTAGIREFEGTGGSPMQPSHVDGVVLHGGPFDLSRVFRWAQTQTTPEGTIALSAVPMLLGGNKNPNSEAYRVASPSTYVNGKSAPTLLMHGSNDNIVPHTEAISMHQLLQARNVPSKLQIMEGAGHGDYGSDPGPVVLNLIAFIKGEAAAQ